MRHVLLTFVLLLPALSWAEDFEHAKKGAEHFEGNLTSFLEHYVGECPEPGMAHDCQEAAAEFRKKNSGRRFFFIISEDQVNLAPGKAMSNGEYTINLTPFVAAGNYAISQGSPHHTDARGNPVFAFVVMKGKTTDEMDAQRIEREVANKSVRIELIFTPKSVWQLPKKGGGKMTGMNAVFNAVQATSTMTGQALASIVH